MEGDEGGEEVVVVEDGAPVGEREEVEEMDEVVVEVHPKRVDVEGDRFVVDDAKEGDFGGAGRGVEVPEEGATQNEAQDGRERLDVAKLCRREELFESGNFVDGTREVVGPDSQDGVEQEDVGRLAGEVSAAVLVAELQVIHERAVGVLHREATLRVHEVEKRRRVRRGARQRGRRDLGRRRLVPVRLEPEPCLEHDPRHRAAHRLEDRLVQVERGVLDQDDRAPVVPSDPGSQTALAHQIQFDPSRHRLVLRLVLAGRTLLLFALPPRHRRDGRHEGRRHHQRGGTRSDATHSSFLCDD
mmetsp:Transcript_5179/g.15745  ORF Transcript_5179/g.15745 Transcript_5179/m.15745 type:complete len:300 (+) Transcript_5179:372-1271(+)